MTPPLDERLERWRQRVERELERWLPPDTAVPQRLHAAQRYGVLGPGKRIRPALVYATAETLGVPLERVDGAACAVELIHAYSLVHDDLPAMDDDDLRRGRPTCHRAFDEATAILAGDSLQVLAFGILARHPGGPDDAAARVQLIATLAEASGTAGMAGGQALDLAAEGRNLSVAELEQIHELKTGALIRASVMMAAQSAPALDDAASRGAGAVRCGHRTRLPGAGRHPRRGGRRGAASASRWAATRPAACRRIPRWSAWKPRANGCSSCTRKPPRRSLREAGRTARWLLLAAWLFGRRH